MFISVVYRQTKQHYACHSSCLQMDIKYDPPSNVRDKGTHKQ